MNIRTGAGIAVAGALLIAVVLVSWPDGGAVAGQVDADGRLEMVMEDYEFVTEEWTVPAEEPVTLVLINRDEVSHPLTFGKDLIIEDNRPVDYTNELFEGLTPRVTPTAALIEPTEDHEGFTVQVQGGSTVTIETEFPSDRVGTWGVGCFIGRGCHFNAGLEGTLHVVE